MEMKLWGYAMTYGLVGSVTLTKIVLSAHRYGRVSVLSL